ncbi:unnamed protein product, partial [Ectocarpus sp. 12 AP-2014]
GIFNEGISGPRWFDFSGAPDVDGFDASTCPSDLNWKGGDPLYLTGVNDKAHRHFTPGLKECITAVRPQVIGCEAAHFFPTNIDVCTWSERKTLGTTEETIQVSRVELEKGLNEEGRYQQEPHISNSTRKGGRTLAIHIRSGDIFFKPHHSY